MIDLDDGRQPAMRGPSAVQTRSLRPFNLRPDPRQRALLARPVARLVPLDTGTNGVYRVSFVNGGAAVYKPAAEEAPGLRPSVVTGSYWKAEIAAYVTDRMLGFALVPTTASADLGRGRGSLQEWAGLPEAPASPARLVYLYAPEDIEMAAVLDYVAGNTDRHAGNWLTGPDGRPITIDNGLCFPSSEASPLRSGFFAHVLGRPLTPGVLAAAGAVDTDGLRQSLGECGLGTPAIEGAVARLEEVRRGSITGRAWTAAGGSIVDEYWDTLRGSVRQTGAGDDR